MKIGDKVTTSVDKGKIVIESLGNSRSKYKIDDLVAQMPNDYYEVKELYWG